MATAARTQLATSRIAMSATSEATRVESVRMSCATGAKRKACDSLLQNQGLR
jgi:hypothetical protein